MNKNKPQVTITFTTVLDNDLWGIKEMLDSGCLSIQNVEQLIKEDLVAVLDEARMDVCIEMVEEF